jgi:hypothetical protein
MTSETIFTAAIAQLIGYGLGSFFVGYAFGWSIQSVKKFFEQV